MPNPKEFLLKRLNFDAETLEFFTHSKNYLNANMVTKALGLLSVPIFTRLLVPESYGILSVFQSVVSILMVVMSAGVVGGIYRRFFEKGSDYQEFLGSNLFFLSVFSFLVILAALFFSGPVSDFFKISPDLLLIAAVTSFFTVVLNIYMRLLQAKNLSRPYSKLVIVQSAILLAVSLFWTYLSAANARHMGAIYASLAISAIFFIYSAFRLLKESRFSFRPEHIIYSLAFGIPLLPHSFGNYFLSYFDRVIIGQISGFADAGLYSLGYNVGMVLMIVESSIFSAWSPKFFAYMAEKKFGKIEELAAKFAKIVFFAAMGIIVFSKDFIFIFTSKAYHESFSIIPVVVFAYVFFFLYSIYQLYSEFRKKTMLISAITVFSTAANIALNYMLIPKYGYQAAAYTTLACFAMMFALHYIVVRFVLKENMIGIGRLAPSFAAFAAVALVYLAVEASVGGGLLLYAAKAAALIILGLVFFRGFVQPEPKRF